MINRRERKRRMDFYDRLHASMEAADEAECILAADGKTMIPLSYVQRAAVQRLGLPEVPFDDQSFKSKVEPPLKTK